MIPFRVALLASALTVSTPVDLVQYVGESNSVGSGNSLASLPSGVFGTSDPNTKIFDASEQGGTGAAWRTLVFGQMEQQPQDKYGAPSGNKNATFTNTVGPYGRFNEIFRAKLGASRQLRIAGCMIGGGGFTDSSTFGRLANYDWAFTDGAYNIFKSIITDAKAALAARNEYAASTTLFIELGGNDVINGFYGTTWKTKMLGFIAQLVTDGIINATDKIIFDRFSVNQTGINSTNKATQNAQIDAIVASDTTRFWCFNTDGCNTLGQEGGGSTDFIHYTTGAQVHRGTLLGFSYFREWHPLQENCQAAGIALGTSTCLHMFQYGSYSNYYSTTGLTSGALYILADIAGSGMSLQSQATVSKQPAIGGFNLANGYPVRYATGAAANSKILVGTAASLYNRTPSVYTGVAKGPATANQIVNGEGGTTSNPLVYEDLVQASGANNFALRNDAGGGLAAGAQVSAAKWNNQWNRFYTVDTGSAITEKVNGVAGTTQSYTRGTITVNRKSSFGASYANGANELGYSDASMIVRCEWSAALSSAVEAAWDAYAQNWCGSN